MAGDINYLTLTKDDVWGKNARQDALAPFFNALFEQKRLIDLLPNRIEPTWRNRRVGQQAISKRLDIFLLSKELMQDELVFKTRVELGGLSDQSLFLSPNRKKNPHAHLGLIQIG